MTDPMDWQERGGHPESSTLLLFLEDEIDQAVRTALSGHIKDCWVCRAECERLNRGMCNFVEYWEGACQQPLPQPPRQYEFCRRLEVAASVQEFGGPMSFVRRLTSHLRIPVSSRIAWISSALSVALLVSLAAFLMLRPTRLDATELLNRARAFRKSVNLGKGTAYHQRVRIRQGSHVAERDLYFGSPKPQASSYLSDALIENSLLQAEIDSNDPLNPTAFAARRDAQAKRSEEVTESPDSYAIVTRWLDDGVIESATLTLARADCRPVSELIAFKDRPPLEIVEVAYEPAITSPLSEVASSAARAPIGDYSARPERVEAPTPVRITDEDLDDAEIQLREVFHRLDVDRNEAPRIWRTDDAIHFEGFFETSERKQQVFDALRGIRFVSPAVFGGGIAASAESASPPGAPSNQRIYTSNPPLAKALWDYFGGLDMANDYMGGVRDAYLRSLPDASALQRLAERYQGRAWENLSRRSQERVDRIAGDYLLRMQINSSDYVGMVSPVLDNMLRGAGQSSQRPNADFNTASGDCKYWRTEAPMILSQLRKLHDSFQRLFVIEQSDTPIDLSVENLLRDASDARAAVQGQLSRVCQP